jgi:hypothetical protein
MYYPSRNTKPETIWLRYVRQRLQLAYGPTCRLVKIMGGLGQEPGVSDLIGVIQGKGVAIELKTPGGKYQATPKQLAFLDGWKAAGGVGVVVASEDDLKRFMAGFEVRQGRLF